MMMGKAVGRRAYLAIPHYHPMANLHRAQYANNPRHAPRNPTTYLTYLGTIADGYSAPTWLVHGEETTDVSTFGNGYPARGMQYLGAAQDPDTGRGWMVRCDRQSSRVIPRLPALSLTSNWICEHADPQRRNSYTSASFDPTTATEIPSLADRTDGLISAGLLPRYWNGSAAWCSTEYHVYEPSDEDYDPEIGDGENPYQLGPWLFQALPDSEDLIILNFGLLSSLGYEVTDWETFAIDALAIIPEGDHAGEVIMNWRTGTESVDLAHYITIFAADGSGFRKSISLSGSVSLPISLRPGADTLPCGNYLCTPVYESFDGTEYAHFWQISTDTETAYATELTGAEINGLVGSVWGTPEDTLPQSWVSMARFIVQDGSGGTYAFNPSAPATPDWTYAGNKRIRPLAFDGNVGICACEESTYQDIDDTYASTDYHDDSTSATTRTVLTEGLATTGGILYLTATTGAEIAYHPFTDADPVTNGSSLGPLLEVRTMHIGPSWTSEPHPDPMLTAWPSYWPAILVFMRAATYIGSDPGPAPEPEEIYPYTDSPLGNQIYEDTGAFVSLPPDDDSDYYHAVVAKRKAYCEALVRFVFEVFGARPSPSHYIKFEASQFEWNSQSTTGNDYDGLHSYTTSTIENEPPEDLGEPIVNVIGTPEDYEGTDEAASIPNDEQPANDWITGPAVKTFLWNFLKVWRNVQDTISHTRTATPLHAFGPISVANGMIYHSPPATVFAEAKWQARTMAAPATVAWTFTISNPGDDIMTGNSWIDSTRFFTFHTTTGIDWYAIGLDPALGEPPSGEDPLLIPSGRTVFDGAGVQSYYCDWARGPG